VRLIIIANLFVPDALITRALYWILRETLRRRLESIVISMAGEKDTRRGHAVWSSI